MVSIAFMPKYAEIGVITEEMKKDLYNLGSKTPVFKSKTGRSTPCG